MEDSYNSYLILSKPWMIFVFLAFLPFLLKFFFYLHTNHSFFLVPFSLFPSTHLHPLLLCPVKDRPPIGVNKAFYFMLRQDQAPPWIQASILLTQERCSFVRAKVLCKAESNVWTQENVYREAVGFPVASKLNPRMKKNSRLPYKQASSKGVCALVEYFHRQKRLRTPDGNEVQLLTNTPAVLALEATWREPQALHLWWSQFQQVHPSTTFKRTECNGFKRIHTGTLEDLLCASLKRAKTVVLFI